MSSFIIEGGHRLKGEITPQGAKNEALQVICASLLTQEEIRITNIPDILDVNNLINLLQKMGVKITRHAKGDVSFCAASLDTAYLESEDYLDQCARLRGSVLLLGPLLARLGEVRMSTPGGDKIGRRRLDTHFYGLQKLGARFFTDNAGIYRIEGCPLRGAYMLLDEASVTGTANILMAAVLAQGETTIYNAACEPYVQQLCQLLVAMGARIDGIGSNLLKITGVSSLHGATHRILPDMIEVGSFMGMAAMVGDGLVIRGVGVRQLGFIPEAFRRLGVNFYIKGDDILIPRQDHYEIASFVDGSFMTIADAPWPGLTPDLISILLVVATQGRGAVLFHQKMFESRLFFVDKLIDMGAQIILCDPHRAVVVGHDNNIRLRGRHVSSPDIRAGIALLIAALGAEGVSQIDNVEQIDRGYERIEQRLCALGAKIKRV